jgi:hypothetical protein
METSNVLTTITGNHIFETLDLDMLSPEDMKKQNVTRLLAKFMKPFFLDAQFGERLKPEEVQMETARSEKAQRKRKGVLPTSE